MWAQQNLEAFLDFALSLIFSVVFINRRLVSVAYQLIKVSLSSCSSTESYCGACFFSTCASVLRGYYHYATCALKRFWAAMLLVQTL